MSRALSTKPLSAAAPSAKPLSAAAPSAKPLSAAPFDPCAVGEADLERIRELEQLLGALNDPLASRSRIEKLANAIPPLSARLVQRARRLAPKMDIDTVGRALGFLGNRGLEAVLLELLEDLTIYKAEHSD